MIFRFLDNFIAIETVLFFLCIIFNFAAPLTNTFPPHFLFTSKRTPLLQIRTIVQPIAFRIHYTSQRHFRRLFKWWVKSAAGERLLMRQMRQKGRIAKRKLIHTLQFPQYTSFDIPLLCLDERILLWLRELVEIFKGSNLGHLRHQNRIKKEWKI